jgi:uncharacterized protein (DUF58 family)
MVTAGASSRAALSGRGRSFITVGAMSIIAGLILGIEDLQRVGVLLLVLPLAAWLVVRQSRGNLRVEHSVAPQQLEVGATSDVTLTLLNPAALATGPLRITETVPGTQQLRFSVSGIRARQRRTIRYPLPALRRGRYQVGPTAVQRSDPFGLVHAESRSAQDTEVVVRPAVTALPVLALPTTSTDGSAAFSHSIGTGGSDDLSVREYRHGDDRRKIHWRSSARTGAIMVRQEERPWQGETLVVLDTRARSFTRPSGGQPSVGQQAADSASFEWAVSAVASIAAHLAGRGRKVSLVTGAGQLVRDSTPAILDLLADVQPTPSTSLGPLLHGLNGPGRDATVIALLAGTDAAAMHELLGSSQRPGGRPIALLLDTADWTGSAGTTAGSEVEPTDPEWGACAAALRGGGWRVVPVRSGDDLGQRWSIALGGTATTPISQLPSVNPKPSR